MRIVIAPDKFKGTLTAVQAANAMARGAREAIGKAELGLYPVADGGQGTLATLLTAVGGSTASRLVTNPLGGQVEATVACLNNGSAVIEMAMASGLDLVAPADRNALLATSFGTGELLEFVSSNEIDGKEVHRIVLGIGGSASTDGGTGAAVALGWRFLDAHGEQLGPGGGALGELAAIEPPPTARTFQEVEWIAACDVDAPLLGPTGAARTFGPQKGASPAEVELLETGLTKLAEQIRIDLGEDIARIPRSGAGGGMGAGAAAFFGARLESGFDLVVASIELEDAIDGADLVLTGEGRLDEQSLMGKATIGVARLAARHGVPCLAVAGEVALSARQLEDAGFVAAARLTQETGETTSSVWGGFGARPGDKGDCLPSLCLRTRYSVRADIWAAPPSRG